MDRFPDEILLHIIHFALGGRDWKYFFEEESPAANLTLVCRRWNALAESLRFRIITLRSNCLDRFTEHLIRRSIRLGKPTLCEELVYYFNSKNIRLEDHGARHLLPFNFLAGLRSVQIHALTGGSLGLDFIAAFVLSPSVLQLKKLSIVTHAPIDLLFSCVSRLTRLTVLQMELHFDAANAHDCPSALELPCLQSLAINTLDSEAHPVDWEQSILEQLSVSELPTLAELDLSLHELPREALRHTLERIGFNLKELHVECVSEAPRIDYLHVASPHLEVCGMPGIDEAHGAVFQHPCLVKLIPTCPCSPELMSDADFEQLMRFFSGLLKQNVPSLKSVHVHDFSPIVRLSGAHALRALRLAGVLGRLNVVLISGDGDEIKVKGSW